MKKGGLEVDKSTIVCRCEEITVADIENAVAQGAQTFDDVKRLTRSGMGLCQGKTCRTVISELIAQIRGESVAAIPVPHMRMPLRAIPIGILADHFSGGSAMQSLLAESKPDEGQES
ncbi:MAG: (2Fe-2S)-binding protein [Veillonellales bacterium]